MTDPVRTTLMIAHCAFTDGNHPQAEQIGQIAPDAITRMAFDKHGYGRIQLSDEFGPQSDGLLDLVDVIRLKKRRIGIEGYNRALIVRVESTRGLDSFAAQKIAEAIEAYADTFKAKEFATAAIHDLDIGQELHGKWNTLLLLRDKKGAWSFKTLRFTSVAKSTPNKNGNPCYAILRGQRVGKVESKLLVATLLDELYIQDALDSGHKIDEDGTYHLVRAPVSKGGAYAVVGNGTQIVYNDDFEVIASGKTDYTVMPAIDVEGTPIDGQVTTVAGKGNDWTVKRGIPASQAGDIAPAYVATA